MMSKNKAVLFLLCELAKAEEKHPAWPKDIIHQAAILSEEAGEVVKEANDIAHHGKSRDEICTEVAQVGAMAIRMLMHLP